MRRSWASITVGALVLLVGVISYKLIRSTSERNTASEGMSVWALFHDATGLFEKSRVMTAGISVGQIEKRELDPKTAKAKITIRIAPNVTLYENAVVTKKSASLLGEYYLEIDPGPEFKEVNGRPARDAPHEGRRGAEERHRAGLARRHDGQRRDADPGHARDPPGRPHADVGPDQRHRQQRQRADRAELGGAGPSAQPRRAHRRHRRQRHDRGGRRRQGVDQERPRDHRVDQVADRHDARAGRQARRRRAAGRSTSCRRRSTTSTRR